VVKVKICGVTSPADAKICVEMEADFLGNIVNITSSPRSITPLRSRQIISALPSHVKGVVVMVPETIKDVLDVAELVNPGYVQLHGYESIEFIERLREELSAQVIKVIHVRGEKSLNEAIDFSKVCDALLLDTPSKSLGGSGERHDWTVSTQIVNGVKCPVFLAGGLNPENVKDAVDRVAPYCVDVSSGVEKSPGVKDPDKVKGFIKGAKHSTKQNP
jgi:phosphoribosylanthranilate isomerase